MARRRTLHGSSRRSSRSSFPDRLDELSGHAGAPLAGGRCARTGPRVPDRGRRARPAGPSPAPKRWSCIAAALDEAGDDPAKKAEMDVREPRATSLSSPDGTMRRSGTSRGRWRRPGVPASGASAPQVGAPGHSLSSPSRAAPVFAEAEQALGPMPEGESPAWWHEWVDIQNAMLLLALLDWTRHPGGECRGGTRDRRAGATPGARRPRHAHAHARAPRADRDALSADVPVAALGRRVRRGHRRDGRPRGAGPGLLPACLRPSVAGRGRRRHRRARARRSTCAGVSATSPSRCAASRTWRWCAGGAETRRGYAGSLRR